MSLLKGSSPVVFLISFSNFLYSSSFGLFTVRKRAALNSSFSLLLCLNAKRHKTTKILHVFWLARLPCYTALDESILYADKYITSLAFFSSANDFTNKISNLFPCNIASSKHLGIWEFSTRVVLETTWLCLVFPNATLVLPTSCVFRWGYITWKHITVYFFNMTGWHATTPHPILMTWINLLWLEQLAFTSLEIQSTLS